MKRNNKTIPLFTIVVCTYNGEKYLEKCLSAIINLKCFDKYVERVCVVDNNSTDSTKRIILMFSEKNNKIRYEFEERQGLAYAREHAAKSVTEWVIYVDDDNILDSDWLIQLEKIINNNPNIGVINGAVIAKPIAKLDSQQKAILQAMYKNLACTHIEEPKDTDTDNTIPMGAGMCIKTKALQKIADEGWLKLKGRTKNNCSSGEDTELCQRVFAQGYGYISSYKMKLYHLIPESRLEEKYIIKLINGLVLGRVLFLKNQKCGWLHCALRKIKYSILLYKYKYIINRQRNINNYWKYKVAMYQSEAYIRYLNNVKVIR